jgi:hypothetical protein
MFDFAYFVNILLNFFTAFQQDIEWKTNLKDIAKAYLKSYFFFDLLSTVPMITTWNEAYYPVKILRYSRFRGFINHINHLFNKLFNKLGLHKLIIERIFNFLSYLYFQYNNVDVG